MDHFLKRCKRCQTIITQCRCPAQDKTVTYGLCETCKNKPQEVSSVDWESIAKFYIGEMHGIMEHLIPKLYQVTVAGPYYTEHEALAASVAISVAKIVKTLEGK